MTTVLVFNESEEGKRAPLYSLLGTISKVVFVDTPEILNDFVADCSKIVTIIVDEMSFLVNIAFKGCVYLKFSSKEKALSVDRVFFYNVVMNAQIQGVFVPNEDVLYEMCDRAFYFFLKSRRNKNGNFMLIDESMFFQNEIKYRVLSDVYNYYDASISSYTKYNSQKIKTLVINLEKDVSRKKYMTQLLPSFHDVEFQKAVYGKEYTLTPEESNYFRYTDMYAFQKKNPYSCAYGDRKLKLAEIGCALSHINVWKKIVSMTYKGLIDEREPVCILEDDVQLSDNYSFKFNELISSLRTLGDLSSSEKWDVCFIGNSDDIPGIDILEEKNFKESVSLIKFNRLSKRTHGGGTFSYLINYYGAQKLLGCINKYGICQAIDWFMLEMCTEINMYKSFPHLITSEYENSNSNIQ